MRRLRHLVSSVLGTAVLGILAFVPTAVGQTAEPIGRCSAYAAVPLPAEASKGPVPKAVPGCASYRSYRGLGRPVNYSEALACAWLERRAQQADLKQNPEAPIAWVVGGSLMLANIYFNGAGVKADIRLAMRFACEADEGMAMLALSDTMKLGTSSRAKEKLELCDYAASTFTMNFCNSYGAEIDDDRSDRYYAALKSSMGEEQQRAFEKLLVAQRAYMGAHASEVHQGGTGRTMRTIGSQRILNANFHAAVVHLERKEWPRLAQNQVAMADAWLRRDYAEKLLQLRTRATESADDGGVTADSLARVQDTWQTYRDAWVTFARLRYPTVVDLIRAEITLDRHRLLKTIQ